MPGRIKAISGEQIAVFLLPLPCWRLGQIDTPKEVFDAHHQLTQLEGFSDIVIRPHFQPYNPINLLTTAGHENNADV
ncbi:hypothetical protein D3C76_1726640 [compost metagenome]|jgi:hypothetical protein